MVENVVDSRIIISKQLTNPKQLEAIQLCPSNKPHNGLVKVNTGNLVLDQLCKYFVEKKVVYKNTTISC